VANASSDQVDSAEALERFKNLARALFRVDKREVPKHEPKKREPRKDTR
jgi:hypothetical protein